MNTMNSRHMIKQLILFLIFSLAIFASEQKPKPSDTKLYKIWSNAYLIEMGNAIANQDFMAFAFFMNEYETALTEEHTRRIKIEPSADKTRYGDTTHYFYLNMTIRAVELDFRSAYFNFVNYLKLMQNRFLYNMDYKPIPDYAK